MIGRLVLNAITRLAQRAGFHGMDDSTHAAILVAIGVDAARYDDALTMSPEAKR